MTERIEIGSLRVAPALHAFVRDEALPGTGVDEAAFWAGAADLVHEVGPRIRDVLEQREVLQRALDEHHRAGSAGPLASHGDYLELLTSIGYLVPEPADFTITTSGVDREVSHQPGPQLVVPILNARFATNAANARWGSLYDALYGTDVIAETAGLERGSRYNAARGAEVVRRGRRFLDEHFPLAGASHADVEQYRVVPAGLVARVDGRDLVLVDPGQLVGFVGDGDAPTCLLLVHHGLHVEVVIDRTHAIGAQDRAGVADIVLEAAITVIMDLEDSVAGVDVEDKVLGYRNWLGLVQGTLTATVAKGGDVFERRMNPDRGYHVPGGGSLRLPGTALLFVRQVGHLMTTDAVLDSEGRPVSEGLLDALVTGLCSVHDLRGPTAGRNSREGAIYVVKPKLHGPEEVRLACDIFARVEQILGLDPATIKIGIMDEERRTSVNLKACIEAAKDRVAFINTGFLDRTGDEIRTSTYAGPMTRKAAMKSTEWIKAYEDRNVDIGLACGFQGRAQIGKGMWAAPDNLAEMVEQKIAHPMAGANCAWVPSPTAATLHALHYHQVDVPARQEELAADGTRATLDQLLTIPLGRPEEWSQQERLHELDNNVQSTLGYVVRWVNAGVGCSKVPDITGTPLMEDRATCRISSQLVSNWLLHGVVTEAQVQDSLRRMAAVVDEQNASDPEYEPMGPAFDGNAFLAARELLIQGIAQPSGYTEPILHRRRLMQKHKNDRSSS